MADGGRVCPRCSNMYQSSEQVQDHECPRCGGMYDKYLSSVFSRLFRKETILEMAGRGRPLWMKAGLTVIMAIMAAFVWSAAGRSVPDAAGNPLIEKVHGVSFSYPVDGTWEGGLHDEFPAQGDVPSYGADYEAVVLVGDGGRVQEIRWTDSHSPLSRVIVEWKDGEVEVVGEERRRVSPGRVLEPMDEYLRVQRQEDGMVVSYNRPRELELELSVPEALSQDAGEPDQGQQLQADRDSETITVPVRLLSDEEWEVPSSQISRLVLKPEKARELWSLFPADTQTVLKDAGAFSGDYIGCTVPGIEVFSGGSSGVSYDFILEQVIIAKVSPESLETVDPENILLLEGGSIMNLHAKAFERQVMIRFTKTGQATLEVKDRRLQPSGQPMVFRLRKTV